MVDCDSMPIQEQLVASGDRERELQRQLTQAGLQAEALLEGSQAAAAAESENMVKDLIEQRDTANDALVVSQHINLHIADCQDVVLCHVCKQGGQQEKPIPDRGSISNALRLSSD